MMDLGNWGPVEWSEGIGGVIAVGGIVWAWAKTRFVTVEDHNTAVETIGARVGKVEQSFVARAQHEAAVETINDRVEAVEKRALAIEAGISGLATKADVAGLSLRMEEANGDRKALAESVRAVADSIRTLRGSLERIENYLLNEKG